MNFAGILQLNRYRERVRNKRKDGDLMFYSGQPVQDPLEGTQLADMMASVPRFNDLNLADSYVTLLMKSAQELGIAVAAVKAPDAITGEQKTYLALSVSPDEINTLKGDYTNELPKWIDYQKHRDTGIVLLNKTIFDVTDVNAQNYMSINSVIMRYIQDMSISKMCFTVEGYKMPDHIMHSAVISMWELDHMRADDRLPASTKTDYERIYKEAVKTYADEKGEFSGFSTRSRNHKVDRDYFKDNFIPVVWESVSEPYYNFMKQQFKAGKYPDFIYYKEFVPYLKIKNIAKKAEKLNAPGKEYFEKDTGRKEWRICYPASQDGMFRSMQNAFNMQFYDNVIPIQELETQSNGKLKTLYLNSIDVANFDRLCKANRDIHWAVNDGTYGNFKMSYESADERIPVLYRQEDEDMINAIVDRLTNEIRDYKPCTPTLMSQFNRISDKDENKVYKAKPRGRDMEM